MTGFTEERLAELIAALPPPPQGWIEGAVELPRARATIDELIARASVDHEIRKAIMADLEDALRAAGLEPRPQLVEQLRVRLSRFEE